MCLSLLRKTGLKKHIAVTPTQLSSSCEKPQFMSQTSSQSRVVLKFVLFEVGKSTLLYTVHAQTFNDTLMILPKFGSLTVTQSGTTTQLTLIPQIHARTHTRIRSEKRAYCEYKKQG